MDFPASRGRFPSRRVRSSVLGGGLAGYNSRSWHFDGAALAAGAWMGRGQLVEGMGVESSLAD